MSLITPQRILELWPKLSAEAQARLVEAAELMAAPNGGRELTEREKAAAERSRADFAAGRVLDERAYDAAMGAFLSDLKSKTPSGT